MVLSEFPWIIFFLILLTNNAPAYIEYITFPGETQDQTSSRPNTLFDDADDLQRQLDNEARDKLKGGKPKTVWVLHLPTSFPEVNYLLTSKRSKNSVEICTKAPAQKEKEKDKDKEKEKDKEKDKNVKLEKNESCEAMGWDYNNQMEWSKCYPDCKGQSQSPINLPIEGLIKAKAMRRLRFYNYDIQPTNISVHNDGKRLILYGHWKKTELPFVYGGAAHSRRYVFHSMTLSWPSEHTVGGIYYPMESQAIHISSDYKTMQEALRAAPKDPLALLGIVSLYMYSDHTQKGLKEIFNVIFKAETFNATATPRPLCHFIPAFKQYVTYQGSLTTPPCTESVMWLVRARSLPVTRALVQAAHRLLNPFVEPGHVAVRMTQPLNDRKIFFFH